MIFTTYPDTGVAGYQKKIRPDYRPDTGYSTQYKKYEHNSKISHKIIRHHHLFRKIRRYSTHSAGTAERNLERGEGAWLGAKGAIHPLESERIGLGKF